MKPQNIEVVTRNLVDPEESPQRMIIDISRSRQRIWFNRHIDWAVRTARSVAIYPTTEAVTFVERTVDTDNPVSYEAQTRGTKRLSAPAQSG